MNNIENCDIKECRSKEMISNNLYKKIVYPSGKVKYEPVVYIPIDSLSEGVWLVERENGKHSNLNLSYLFDLPIKPDHIAFARRIDDIAQAVYESWNEYQEKGSQSPMEVAKKIVQYLAKIDYENESHD
ncbi:MAG: hypothetical protein KatS3mg002_0395 [Candidatus Woesearchaeota archaeon]|nr:MAG: hypothetical protein KatS3mg002_0395 [Candidatus Woesearchaeota archaeon]